MKAVSLHPTHLSALLALGVLVGCTSGSVDRGFALTPEEPTVHVGEQMILSAQPLEDLAQEPEWEVQELYGGGFLNSRGLKATYVAPPSAGHFHLILRGTRPDGSRIKTTEEIRVLPLPQVEPSRLRLGPGGTATFTARMKGLPRNTVTWSVQEAEGGLVSSEGQYVAPARPGTYHVVATSTLDADAVAIATVQVE